MSDHYKIEDWFYEELSDEAAYAIEQYLKQFTQHFSETYYAQIRRHIEAITPDRQPVEEASSFMLEEQNEPPWEDEIPL